MKASGREDLEIEQPVACRDGASLHFHPPLAGMLGTTLVGDQVVQMCQPSQKRLLVPVGMMERLYHGELPLNAMECEIFRNLFIGLSPPGLNPPRLLLIVAPGWPRERGFH